MTLKIFHQRIPLVGPLIPYHWPWNYKTHSFLLFSAWIPRKNTPNVMIFFKSTSLLYIFLLFSPQFLINKRQLCKPQLEFKNIKLDGAFHLSMLVIFNLMKFNKFYHWRRWSTKNPPPKTNGVVFPYELFKWTTCLVEDHLNWFAHRYAFIFKPPANPIPLKQCFHCFCCVSRFEFVFRKF